MRPSTIHATPSAPRLTSMPSLPSSHAKPRGGKDAEHGEHPGQVMRAWPNPEKIGLEVDDDRERIKLTSAT
jgi:hypothetical protein